MKRWLSKAEKRLMLTSCGAITLLASVAMWRVSINATPQVVIPPYPPAPKPNGFDLYIQAADLLETSYPAVEHLLDSPTNAGKSRFSLQEKEAWLKQNVKVSQIFDRALKTSTLAPAFGTDEDPFPSLFKLRDLARFKRIESSTRKLAGDWGGAMQSRLDAVQMGDDTSRGSVLIAAMVNSAIQAIGRSEVWKDIEHLDAKQTQSTIQRLQSIYARRPSYLETMRADNTYGLLELLKNLRKPDWRDMDKWAEQHWGDKPTWKERLQATFLSKQAVVDNYMTIADGILDNAKLSYGAKPKPLPPANNPFTRDSIGTINVRWMFACNDAANAMWLVALALHAYNLEHGNYPSELRVLEGKYLKQIPADPFGGGEALRYERTGESYILWSVGPDAINDGGKPIPPDKTLATIQKGKLPQVLPNSKGDFVWGKNQ